MYFDDGPGADAVMGGDGDDEFSAPDTPDEGDSYQGFGGTEVTTAAPTKPVTLPDWAEASVKSLKVQRITSQPTDFKLSNGLRLIVRPAAASAIAR